MPTTEGTDGAQLLHLCLICFFLLSIFIVIYPIQVIFCKVFLLEDALKIGLFCTPTFLHLLEDTAPLAFLLPCVYRFYF